MGEHSLTFELRQTRKELTLFGFNIVLGIPLTMMYALTTARARVMYRFDISLQVNLSHSTTTKQAIKMQDGLFDMCHKGSSSQAKQTHR